jgi:hypothetical protein
MNNLESIYQEMNIRNKISTENIIIDSTIQDLNSYKNNYCYAIYSLNNFILYPSWIRLIEWLNSFINDEAIIYNLIPEKTDGMLHQTLLQILSFKESIKYTSIDINKSLEECKNILNNNNKHIKIIYRGLVFTKTGLAIRGFPYIENDYNYIMNLRKTIENELKTKQLPCDIPYFNNILHATLLRWKKMPSDFIINKLNDEINKWEECIIGELRINNWTIGKATWKMLDHERDDIYEISTKQLILHRGLSIHDRLTENEPNTLATRDNNNLNVECDIWYHKNKWYLGHDSPTYLIENIDLFLKSKQRLIHAKDGKTLAEIIDYCNKRGYDNEIFYHTNEDYVLTTSNMIIAYPGKELYKNTLCMMPENMNREITNEEYNNIIGVCSDNL